MEERIKPEELHALIKSAQRDVSVFIPYATGTQRVEPFKLSYVTLDEAGNRIEVNITIQAALTGVDLTINQEK